MSEHQHILSKDPNVTQELFLVSVQRGRRYPLLHGWLPVSRGLAGKQENTEGCFFALTKHLNRLAALFLGILYPVQTSSAGRLSFPPPRPPVTFGVLTSCN